MRRTLFHQICGLGLFLLLTLLATAGCERRISGVSVLVVDESGAGLAGVRLVAPSQEVTTSAAGRARLKPLAHPMLFILSKTGYLDEPVTVGWAEQGGEVRVTLLSDLDGRRLVIHSGGDTMLGRRFLDPVATGAVFANNGGMLNLGDGGESARSVVSDLVPLFRASDLRVLNLECAVGNLDASGEYPGKRWVLNMFPESLSALEALGVGVAGIANNHVRDFLEAGVQSTLDAAALYGIKTVGAGPTQASAEAPVIVECKGKTIGILAYTSVDGNYVNDQYPVDGETKPSTVAAEDAWSWVPRSWGWSGGGLEISEMERRIGSAWIEFSSIEDQLSDTDKAAAWSSLTGVYPELQDWVARRGHGGAARWNNLTSPAAITALKQQVDIVLVQLHSGFQYAEAPSDPMRTSAYAAVDAGADLIVGHHPHNLQGFEYYKNKLIAWSLGNLVFDQNFLLTFPSVVLRTVWEDDRMIQARLIPLSIDNYRPVPQADETARRVLRQVADCSATGATAARGDDAIVRAMLPSVDAIPAGHVPNFEFERHTVVLTDSLPVENTFSLSIPAAQPVAVSNRGLVWGRVQARATTGLWVGRSLFPYGSFENEGTGEGTGEAPFWNLD